MRPEFNTEQWEKFWRGWDHVIKKFPDAKRMAMREMGKFALDRVITQINQQGINDSRGRVKKWQNMRLGSGGGYVAVSPTAAVVKITKGSKTGIKGSDITRYLERGHGVRGPSGRAKRYEPRYQYSRIYVPGRQFYSYAKMGLERKAVHAAERNVLVYLENMLDDLYGDALYE